MSEACSNNSVISSTCRGKEARKEGWREGGRGKTSLGRKTTYYAAQRVYTSVRRRVGGPECPDAKQNLTN